MQRAVGVTVGVGVTVQHRFAGGVAPGVNASGWHTALGTGVAPLSHLTPFAHVNSSSSQHQKVGIGVAVGVRVGVRVGVNVG